MKFKVSLPNALLVSSIALLVFIPSLVVLGLVLITALHANATRFSRYKKQEQAASYISNSQAQETRLRAVEDELKKLVGAMNISKMGRG